MVKDWIFLPWDQNKARMFIVIILIQHSTGISSQVSKIKKY